MKNIDIKIRNRWDEAEYSPSEIMFNKNDVTFPEEESNLIFNFNSTIKVCLNHLHLKGKIICPNCGLEATILRRDKSFDQNGGIKGFHWAFYGIKNDTYTLFTKDHIIPRSIMRFGTTAKFTPMCEFCNSLKGNKINGITKEEINKRVQNRKSEQFIYNFFIVPVFKKIKKHIKSEDKRHKINLLKTFLMNNLDKDILKMNNLRYISNEYNNQEIELFDKSIFNNIFLNNSIIEQYDEEKINQIKIYRKVLLTNVNEIKQIFQ